MHAWPQPRLSTLPTQVLGPAPELRLYDARTGRVEATTPDDEARLYVCGITPYDATHMGHAATYVTFDLVNRAWREAGHAVRYVQNITDVDDPLLERAAATHVDWRTLAAGEIALFREDMTALGVIPPDVYAGVVESISLIASMVERLARAGAVYRLDDDLYLDVSAADGFGSVSGLAADSMVPLFAERGGDPDRPGKRHRLDWLIWRGERRGEPSWDVPRGPDGDDAGNPAYDPANADRATTNVIGRGRPGWHVECSAIAEHYLGHTFDLQGGGSDLVFPHHEMSAAEVSIVTGEPFAKGYVHGGMVGLDGEKMSKSRGNLVLVSELRRSGIDPRALRLVLLSQQYRVDWEWTSDLLTIAQDRLKRWTEAIAPSVERPVGSDRGARTPGLPAVEDDGGLEDDGRGDNGLVAIDVVDARDARDVADARHVAREVRACLAEDLDAPAALGLIDAWVDEAGGVSHRAATLIAETVLASLGVDLSPT